MIASKHGDGEFVSQVVFLWGEEELMGRKVDMSHKVETKRRMS
jgi:hypothetical protein